MFMNFWYVGAESRELTETPMHLKMLGFDFVLFRDTKGQAHCLSNLCVHRGALLAHGKVKGDCIRVPLPRMAIRRQRRLHQDPIAR